MLRPHACLLLAGGAPRRDKQPWESSDGAIYLLREVARVAPDVARDRLVAAQAAFVDRLQEALAGAG